MEIDWFTLIAQVLNFLVLVWLLRRLLYGRILQAMNDREAAIKQRLQDAAQARMQADEEAARYHRENQALEAQRDQWLRDAKAEAEVGGQQLLVAARLRAEQAQQEWLATLRREQQALLQELRERVGQQVVQIARRTVKDLAHASLEEQLVAVFLERLQHLPAAERETLAATVKNLEPVVEVRCAFPLTKEQRDRVTTALREHLGENVEVHYSVAPELVCGVELRAHSHRLAWNADAYLEGLEKSVLEAMDERAGEHG